MNEHSRILERDKLDIDEPLRDVDLRLPAVRAARAFSD